MPHSTASDLGLHFLIRPVYTTIDFCITNNLVCRDKLELHTDTQGWKGFKLQCQENIPSDICTQRRFGSTCTFAQSNGCSLGSQECRVSSNGQGRLLSDYTHAHADLKLCLTHTSEGTFTPVAAHPFMRIIKTDRTVYYFKALDNHLGFTTLWAISEDGKLMLLHGPSMLGNKANFG